MWLLNDVALHIGCLSIFVEQLDSPLHTLFERHFGSIGIDGDEQVCGVHRYLGAFIVAGGSAHATYVVAIYRHTLDVELPATDTIKYIIGCSYSQSHISLNAVGIETTYRVARTHRDYVDEVYQSVDAVEVEAANSSATQGFG